MSDIKAAEINEIKCETHNSHGKSFCLTCISTLCEICNSNNSHKNHKLTSLEELSSSILLTISNIEKNIIQDISLLESNHSQIIQFESLFNNKKEEYSKLISSLKASFNSEVTRISESQKEEIIKIYNNSDLQIDAILDKVKNNSSNIKDFLIKLESIKEVYENLKSNEIIGSIFCCGNKKLFQTCMELQNTKTIDNLLNNLKSLIENSNEVKIILEAYYIDFIERQKLLESLVQDSLILNKQNLNYFVRRFESYNKHNLDHDTDNIELKTEGSKLNFFQKSFLSFKVRNKDLVFSGIGVCGLIDSNSNDSQNLNVKLSIYENSSPVNLFRRLVNKEKEDLIKDDQKLIHTQEIILYKIKNEANPVIKFSLSKEIKITKNYYYSIVLENESNNYTSIYLGKTNLDHKTNTENLQEIVCSNTDSDLVFFQEKQFSSDFDELSKGIISDIWFYED